MIVSSLSHPNRLLSKIISITPPDNSPNYKHSPHHLFSYSSLILSQIPTPTSFTYNLLIRALSTSWQNYSSALRLFINLLRAGLCPDSYTFPFVLLSCANLPALRFGKSTHAQILNHGLCDNDHTVHSLITMYTGCNESGCARKVFDEITKKDLVSWNSMISGYVKMGHAEEAVACFKRMSADGWAPNQVTLVSVLAACGEIGDLELGKSVEEFVERENWEFGSFIGSALIDMYGKCGDLESAKRVFGRVEKKDSVIWNAMITGYAQNGVSNEAISLFHSMQEANINPNKMTLAGVLPACASVGALHLGKYLDNFALNNGLYSNVYVGTALIDMYGKCGNIERALEVFDEMPHKNEASWNALIAALAFNGRGREAIRVFRSMIRAEICPDYITFIGILSACVHSGLVEEGRELFNRMQFEFQISPKIEHLSCMVDLLARAGYLEESWGFIEKMGDRVDAVILGSLLSACHKSKCVKVGEKVMERILEIEPCNSWNYVVSSKIYERCDRLSDSARMRGLMRERRVSKTPGCSWIEICGELCEFYAGAELHFKAEEIYRVIGLLVWEMRLEGYFPNTELL